MLKITKKTKKLKQKKHPWQSRKQLLIQWLESTVEPLIKKGEDEEGNLAKIAKYVEKLKKQKITAFESDIRYKLFPVMSIPIVGEKLARKWFITSTGIDIPSLGLDPDFLKQREDLLRKILANFKTFAALPESILE